MIPYQFFPSFLLSWDREVTRYPYLHSHGIIWRSRLGWCHPATSVRTHGTAFKYRDAFVHEAKSDPEGDIRRRCYQDYRSLQAVEPPFALRERKSDYVYTCISPSSCGVSSGESLCTISLNNFTLVIVHALLTSSNENREEIYIN